MAYIPGLPNDDLRTCRATIEPMGLLATASSPANVGITIIVRGKRSTSMSHFFYLGVATAVTLSCNPALADSIRPQASSSLHRLTIQAQMPQPYLEPV